MMFECEDCLWESNSADKAKAHTALFKTRHWTYKNPHRNSDGTWKSNRGPKALQRYFD